MTEQEQEQMFAELKTFFQNLFNKYFNKPHPSPVPVPAPSPAPAPSGGTTLPPHADPDANGFVALSAVSNEDYVNSRHQIKEISDTLPPASFQRESAQLNLSRSQGLFNIEGIVDFPALQVEEYFNAAKGMQDWRFKDPQEVLQGTHSWPAVMYKGFNLAKEQGVVEYINSLPASTPSSGFSHSK
jgi:hypothetical protein